MEKAHDSAVNEPLPTKVENQFASPWELASGDPPLLIPLIRYWKSLLSNFEPTITECHLSLSYDDEAQPLKTQ